MIKYQMSSIPLSETVSLIHFILQYVKMKFSWRIFLYLLEINFLVLSKKYLVETKDSEDIKEGLQSAIGNDYQNQGCMPGYPCDGTSG